MNSDQGQSWVDRWTFVDPVNIIRMGDGLCVGLGVKRNGLGLCLYLDLDFGYLSLMVRFGFAIKIPQGPNV